MSRKATILAVSVGMLGMCAVQASSMSLGEFEYLNSCAQCHGSDGKGNGPMTEFLTQAPPDLTVLSKNNGGVLPVSSMYEIIDGSSEIGAHGREMPVWGKRYTLRAFEIGEDETADPPFDPARDYQEYVRVRILALIEHLASIQEE